MLSTKLLRLLLWQLAGIPIAIALVMLQSLAGLAWVTDNSIDGAIATAMQCTFFLVAGAPVAHAFLWLWVFVAERIPKIETNVYVRFAGLAVSAGLLGIVGILIMTAVSRALDGDIGATRVSVKIYWREILFMGWTYSLWCVAPRLLLKALRPPMLFAVRA